MQRLFPLVLWVLCLALLPNTAYGAEIDYAFVVEEKDDQVRIKRSTLSTEHWYQCFIDTRECSEVASTTKLLSEPPIIPAKSAWQALLPPGASWRTVSPDGKYVAFYVAATEKRGRRTFGILDTSNSKLYTKDEPISYWDLLTEGINIFSFSPDSRTLLYLDDIKKHPTLYRVDLSTLDPNSNTFVSSRLFTREYVVADMGWKDEDTILFIANRENPYLWALYEYRISTNTLRKIADNVSYAVNLRKIGDLFLYSEVSETGVRPKIYDPGTDTVYSFSLPPVSTTKTRGKVVTTLATGLTGIFLLEKSSDSKTLLVWLHGGPYRQTSIAYHPYLSYAGYDWVLEQVRAADVGILKIDYPGSAGFGRPFAESIMGNVGVKDAGDVRKAIADFARRNHYTNVYLMGNSYGGYLALKLLVDKPHAYKGALSINGVSDWTTMLTAADVSIFNKQFDGPPNEKNYKAYANASIYNHIDALTNQKIVLVHGEKDMTIPYHQSEGLAISLVAEHKPVGLITLSGEDHVYKKPESFEMLCRATLAMVGRIDEVESCEL